MYQLSHHGFNGAVYYEKKGQIKQYYQGYQEFEKQHLINRNTQFNLASLSKSAMYTAVMIFQLGVQTAKRKNCTLRSVTFI